MTSTKLPDDCPDLDLSLQESDIENWIKNNLPSHNRPKERVLSLASLSSASSCEMYTSTDESNDEQLSDQETAQPRLPAAARKAINMVMRKVEADLNYAAFTKCQGGSTSASQGISTPSSQQSGRKTAQSGTKRKLKSDDLPADDNGDDGANKRRRGSLATVNSSDTGAMFACPFYKHDSNQYRNRRTCLGPGWPTVHRMKEHLYRAHAQSICCPRCYAMFDTDGDLSTHLRSAQCQVSAPQPIEGIDRETIKALRKRSPALRTEDDKWRDVYHLLFPDVPAEDIPSPFYGDNSPDEASRRFRRELLRRVQRELVTTAQRIPRHVEQQLLRHVAGIIRRVEEDLLSSNSNSNSPSNLTLPQLSDRRSSTTSTSSTSSFPRPPTPLPLTAPLPMEPISSPRAAFAPPSETSLPERNDVWLSPMSPVGMADDGLGVFRSIIWNHPAATDLHADMWAGLESEYPAAAAGGGGGAALDGGQFFGGAALPCGEQGFGNANMGVVMPMWPS